MAETVRARGVEADRIAVINNFDPWPSGADPAVDASGSANRQEAGLRMVFAGISAGSRTSRPGRQGDGALRERPASSRSTSSGTGRCGLGGAVRRGEPFARPLPRLRRTGSAGRHDVAGIRPRDCLAAPRMTRTAYPSQTITYLRKDCPVLALVETTASSPGPCVTAGADVRRPDSPAELESELEALLTTRPTDRAREWARPLSTNTSAPTAARTWRIFSRTCHARVIDRLQRSPGDAGPRRRDHRRGRSGTKILRDALAELTGAGRCRTTSARLEVRQREHVPTTSSIPRPWTPCISPVHPEFVDRYALR